MDHMETDYKKEYEAEVWRQTHPYEQWIAENEKTMRTVPMVPDENIKKVRFRMCKNMPKPNFFD